jgi:hypothetical protein
MNAQQVWQAQELDAPRISLEYIRHISTDFDRRRQQRAALGYAICIGACAWWAFCAWKFFSTKPLMLAALLCWGLYALYAFYRTRRHVSVESSPANAGVLDTLRYQRRQLERQRDFRRSGWRINLTVLPGYALMLASMYFENSPPASWHHIGFWALFLVVALALAAWAGERQARRSQREIDALDSLTDDS